MASILSPFIVIFTKIRKITPKYYNVSLKSNKYPALFTHHLYIIYLAHLFIPSALVWNDFICCPCCLQEFSFYLLSFPIFAYSFLETSVPFYITCSLNIKVKEITRNKLQRKKRNLNWKYKFKLKSIFQLNEKRINTLMLAIDIEI